MHLPEDISFRQRIRRWHPHYVRHLIDVLNFRGTQLYMLLLTPWMKGLARASVGPTPFIVLADARTGSYMLMSLLNAHPEVVAYGEMFNPGRPLESVVPGTRNRQRAAPGRLLRRRLWHTGHPAGRTVGFKLLYGQGVGVSAPVWPYLRAMSNLRVIHLTRRNSLARQVSLTRALRDGVWTVSSGAEPSRSLDPVVLDIPALLASLGAQARWVAHAREAFARSQVLEVAYEDLVADQPAQMKRVFEFLGVPPRAVTADTRKIGGPTLRDDVANWHDVCQALRGTRWEWMLEEPSAPGVGGTRGSASAGKVT